MPPGTLGLDRWARWLVMALDRHVLRQRWLTDIVVNRLGADLNAVGTGRHPALDSGRVPGEREWSFSFHGRGCLFQHDDGTELDVDFYEGSGEWIDPYFYERWLVTTRSASTLERPLLTASWRFDLAVLKRSGFLTGEHAFRFTEVGQTWARALRGAATALSDGPLDPWLAWIIEDPLLARQSCASPVVEHELERIREDRRHRLTVAIDDEREGPHALLALAELSRPAAAPVVRSVLTGSTHGPLVRAALGLVGRVTDPVDLSLFLTAARRFRAVDPLRNEACRQLMWWWGPVMGPELRAEVAQLLESDTSACAAESALMLALLDPTRGEQRLRKQLQSTIPVVRTDSAAALELLRVTSVNGFGALGLEEFVDLVIRWRLAPG